MSDHDPYATVPTRAARGHAPHRTAARIAGAFLLGWGLVQGAVELLLTTRGAAPGALAVFAVADLAIGVALLAGVPFARAAGIVRAALIGAVAVALLAVPTRAGISMRVLAAATLLVAAGLLALLVGRPSTPRVAAAVALLAAGMVLSIGFGVVFGRTPPRTSAAVADCSSSAYVPTRAVVGARFAYHAALPPDWCLATEASLEPTRTLTPDQTLVRPASLATLYVGGQTREAGQPALDEAAFTTALERAYAPRARRVDVLDARPLSARPDRRTFGVIADFRRGPERVQCTLLTSPAESVVACVQVDANDRAAVESAERFFASIELGR